MADKFSIRMSKRIFDDLLSDFDTYGYAIFTDNKGVRYLMAHGLANGAFQMPNLVRNIQAQGLCDHIICCYPGTLKRLNLDLPIMGDWTEPTWFDDKPTKNGWVTFWRASVKPTVRL